MLHNSYHAFLFHSNKCMKLVQPTCIFECFPYVFSCPLVVGLVVGLVCMLWLLQLYGGSRSHSTSQPFSEHYCQADIYIVMIIVLMACNDNKKLCSHIMIMKHLTFI